MSSESDTEEFFDAEEATPIRSARAKAQCDLQVENQNTSIVQSSKDEPAKEVIPVEEKWETEQLAPRISDEQIKEAEKKAKESERRRKRVEELRRRVLHDDDDDDDGPELLSEESSIASSVDGIYVPGASTMMTSTSVRPITESAAEDDIHSMISLGKIGTILSEGDQVNGSKRDISSGTLSQLSKSTDSLTHVRGEESLPAPEPDVVASTKGGDRSLDHPQPPVPPPRRKKKPKIPSSLSGDSVSIDEESIPAPQGLPSPTSTVESFVRELENSLDLNSAVRGQYVVKPQDMEQDRADGHLVGPSPSTPEYPKKDGSLSSLNARETQPSKESDSGSTPEGSFRQLNMVMRTRSDSGRQLTDLEILEQVTVVNLDTGEQIPLSIAEERLPKCINPLSLHIMRLTSEYVSNSEREKESDEESVDSKSTSSRDTLDSKAMKKKAKIFKKMIGRSVQKTVNKIKTVADEVYHTRHSEDIESSEEEILSPDARPTLKVKVSHSHKRPYDFDCIRQVQEMGEHSGAIWTMKFSSCGRLLATAGHVLHIWVLRDAYSFFDDMRQKYNAEAKVSPAPSQESLSSQQPGEDTNKMFDSETTEDVKGPFMSKPFCTYEGHTADLLDVSWSKNYFILSSSMDKTVRLWHISRKECLCCFQHIDFVTAIAFHPRDDRYFLSGSLDGKLRLWNIPDKKVALWNELDGQTKLITAANFCQNGKFAVVGSYDGRCIFYHTEQLKYYTQIHVRSTRGKNRQGRKISGIEPMPGEDKILVTSNDSRIRLYDLRDLSLSCKYKGAVNPSSQIKGSFSHDGKYIISGSENQFFYIWKTYHDYSKFSSARRDRNDYWEGIKAHNAVVTAAVFAPNPGLIMRQINENEVGGDGVSASSSESNNGYVIVSADFSGVIKVFVNKTKSKTGASGTTSTTH